jgi:hypothetical protein
LLLLSSCDGASNAKALSLIASARPFSSEMGYCVKFEDGKRRLKAETASSGSFSLVDSAGFEYDYAPAERAVSKIDWASSERTSIPFLSDVAYATLDSFSRAVISEIGAGAPVYSSNDMLPFVKKSFSANGIASHSINESGKVWYSSSVGLAAVTGDESFSSAVKSLAGDAAYASLLEAKSWSIAILLASDFSKAYPSMEFHADNQTLISL